MPLLDIQRRAQQLGRIRIGNQVATSNGRMRPAKLGTFRLTTASRRTADAVAAELGGTVQPFTTARTAGQWEVITELAELPVMIPANGALTQDYELWTAAGCARRCDSQVERISGQPCMCPSDPRARQEAAKDGEACKAVTRLNVMLPDLPGLGLWRLDTSGYYAAVELGAAADLLQEARAMGVSIPAELAIEQREARRPGQQVKTFPVPVLRVLTNLREMAAIGAGERPSLAALLPPPIRAVAALTSGQERQRREELTVSPAQALADRAQVATDVATVRAIWDEASAQWVLDEFVAVPGTDVMEMLREVLLSRVADLERAGDVG
jgi:hypothetical protein